MNIIKHTCPYCFKEFEVAENTVSAICPSCNQHVFIKPPQDYKKMQEQMQPQNKPQGQQDINVPNNTYSPPMQPPQYGQQQYYNPNQPPPQYSQPQNYNPNQPPPQYNQPQNYNPDQPPPQYSQPQNYNPDQPPPQYSQPQNYNPNQPPPQYSQPQNNNPNQPPPQYQQPQNNNPNQPPQYQQPQYYNSNQPPQYYNPNQPPQYYNPNQPPQYGQPQYYNPNQPPQYSQPVKTNGFKKFINENVVPAFKSVGTGIKKFFGKGKQITKKELPPRMSTPRRIFTTIVTIALVLSLSQTLTLTVLRVVSSDKSLDKIQQDLDLSKMNIIAVSETTNEEEEMSLSEFMYYYTNSWGVDFTKSDYNRIFSNKDKIFNKFIIENVKEYRDFFMGKSGNASITIREIEKFLNTNSNKIGNITKKNFTPDQQAIIVKEIDGMIELDSFSSKNIEQTLSPSVLNLIHLYLSDTTYIISVIFTIILLSLSFIISPVHILRNTKRVGIIFIVFGCLHTINGIAIKITFDVIANFLNTTNKVTDVLASPFTSTYFGIGIPMLIVGILMVLISAIITRCFFIKRTGAKKSKITLENVEI